MDTIVYTFEGNLYLNLTNRCSNNCDFCIRNHRDGIGDRRLWISREPSIEETVAEIEKIDLNTVGQCVFCGYGEPTYRMDAIVAVGAYLKKKGKTVRVDTNGNGNLINARDITNELKKSVDAVSVSLNASTAAGYQKICKSIYGEAAYEDMLGFAIGCKRAGLDVRFSVVDTVGKAEVNSCKRLAAELGIPLRVRTYIK